MAFKLASDAAAAWAAIVLSAVGGTSLTIYNAGRTTQQIQTITDNQRATDAHVQKHDDVLTDIQKQQAANAQKLQDIADTVHDMRDNGVKRK